MHCSCLQSIVDISCIAIKWLMIAVWLFFRELPEFSKHYIMRLLFVDQNTVTQTVVAAWANSQYHKWDLYCIALYLSISIALFTAWTFPDHSNWHCVGDYKTKRYRQLQVKDLPKFPTWRLERYSNPQPSDLKASTLPMRHHAPRDSCSFFCSSDSCSCLGQFTISQVRDSCSFLWSSISYKNNWKLILCK